ncbi:MAG: histidine kinase [Gammaproteobacteria bacterium]|nr:histidine kinase [Gammaproteobacteria bacterium]
MKRKQQWLAFTPPKDAFFLPDLCSVGAVFLVVLGGELLAFLFTLMGSDLRQPWSELGLTSLFIQWVALGSAALLCLGRRWLRRMAPARASLVMLALVSAVCLLSSLVALRLQVLTLPAGWQGQGLFLVRNLLVSVLLAGLAFRYFYLQHEMRQRLVTESQARIAALQARIQPHFLFNSMNIIASLTRVDPIKAERVVEDLASLFRASLEQPGTTVSLKRELSLCRHYLDIEQLRLGERLSVDWQVDDNALVASLPLLSLQPLLENAIYHGISRITEGGLLSLSVRARERGVEIHITNPVPRLVPRAEPGNQIALGNLRERLALLYGTAAKLNLREEDGQFCVSLWIPLSE